MVRKLLSILTLVMFVSASYAQKDIPFIDAAPFDTVMNGQKVALYTISNDTIAAQVTNYGAFLVSLFSPDKEGNYANIITGYDNVKQYIRYNMGAVGPTVGRYANRIANGKFTLDGTEYQITKNSGQHTLHGGAQGFDKTIWKVIKAEKSMVVMQCTLADGLDGFPGNLTTTLTFAITTGNCLNITFDATTDKATVVNTTIHSYFNLNGAGNGNILGHYLKINADFYTETDRSLIPTGNLLKVDNTPYDFRRGVKIGNRQIEVQGFGFGFGQRPEIPEGKVMSYDTNFCLNHRNSKVTEKIAELLAPESGRIMEVWNNHPGLQLYTGGRTAIALESQMFPDSPNHPDFPSTTLLPGQTYHHNIIYKLSVEKL